VGMAEGLVLAKGFRWEHGISDSSIGPGIWP